MKILSLRVTVLVVAISCACLGTMLGRKGWADQHAHAITQGSAAPAVAAKPAVAVEEVKASETPILPTAFPSLKVEDPPNRGLDANLYMQTSAEYRACCYQAYTLALFRLKEAVAQNPEGPRAVVLDLDETVIDNAGFQAMQLRSNLAYDQRLWDLWEEKGGNNLALIPGAKEFLQEAGNSESPLSTSAIEMTSSVHRPRMHLSDWGLELRQKIS